MDASKEEEVKQYIEEKEKTEWLSGVFEVTADLVWIEKETKESILSNWLKNNEELLTYAKLTMKERLTAWEKIRYNLLELKLSIPLFCPYFADFKDFLQELKRWTDTSTDSATDTISLGSSSESAETFTNKFCWTNINGIKSEPFERSSSTWVTWCSKTARNNWKNFWIILPAWNAYDAWKLPWKDCIATIPSNRQNEKPSNKWKWLDTEIFISEWKWNYADIYTDSKSTYWHRAAAFKDDSWQWYVLDPYTRVNWRLDNSPKKLEDYLKFRKIVKAHMYESKWYLPASQEVAQDPKVENAVQWAIGIAEDNCHWYERWGKGNDWQYDCSGLVTNAFKQAWFNVPVSWTATMRENFTKVWFEWISPYDSSKLQRWDILLKDKWKDGERHTEIYTWNWKFVWARSNKDWKSWDSSWNEIAESSENWLKTFWWNGILRYRW